MDSSFVADDATTPSYAHPELRSAYLAFFGPEEGSYNYLVAAFLPITITLRQTARLNQDDATTPGYAHPELRSAYRAFFGPEEGSYNYSAADSSFEQGS